eukprot:TRINITY_DN181_c1_g1_i2.p1 TRINITY_DN181_c1_g1~~TRINITY_DN181_c1_g1_i2.p1  ORF type:complete len:467 (-),score=89.25 TRINITY_DN181_c1_g1_i2:1143-2543(-)
MALRQFSQEIRRDPNLFIAFYSYVQKQHCHEALHFFLRAELYAETPQPQRKQMEVLLWDEHLVERSPEKINIADPLLKRIVNMKGHGLSRIYHEAKKASDTILTGDSWPYFKEEFVDKVAKEKPIKEAGLKKAFLKAGMSESIANAAVYMFSGKQPTKLDPVKLPGEPAFKDWLYDATENREEVIAAILKVDPDPTFLRGLFSLFSSEPAFLLGIFKLLLKDDIKDFADSKTEESLSNRLKSDSPSFIFYKQWFHFFEKDWLRSFLEPLVRKYYSMKFASPEEAKEKIVDISTSFLADFLEKPPSDAAFAPLSVAKAVLNKKFSDIKDEDIYLRVIHRWLSSVLANLLSFPNSWLDTRLFGPIDPRYHVAMIEDILHAPYLGPKSRRQYVTSTVLKKVRVEYQPKFLAFFAEKLALDTTALTLCPPKTKVAKVKPARHLNTLALGHLFTSYPQVALFCSCEPLIVP